jgi:hypothetical protein
MAFNEDSTSAHRCNLVGPGCGTGPALNAHLLIDMLPVFLHNARIEF